MIKQLISHGRAHIEIMIVVDRYITEGFPECDLLDSRGILHQGCSIMSLGGGITDLFSVPALNAEVIALSSSGATPYIVGVLAEVQTYQASPQITPAGEYPSNQIGMDHAQLKSSGSRIIATEGALYLEPRARIQGALEVSSGAEPLQSFAVAEPTIDTLETYQARLTEMRSAIINLQSTLSSIVTALKLDIPLGAPTNLNLVTLPSDPVATITAPDDRIASEIAKLER